MAQQTRTFMIKTHEHELTEKYVYLRREIEERLGVEERFRNYTTQEALDNLKNYRETASTFHAVDHWYAFEGDKLIGYAHLWPTYTNGEEEAQEEAVTDIPGVIDDDPEVREALMKSILERAKKIGVKTLRIGIDSENKVQLDLTKSNGFEKGDITQLRATTDVNSFNFQNTEGVTLADYSDDYKDRIIEAYDAVDITKEFVENQIEQIRNMGERVFFWKVSLEGETLTGHALALRYNNDGEQGQIIAVTRGVGITDEQYENAIHALYREVIDAAKNADVKRLDIFLNTQRLNLKPIYESIGVKFNEIYSWTRSV